MSGTCHAHALARDVGLQRRRELVQVVISCRRQPGIDRGRIRQAQRDLRLQWHHAQRVRTGDLVQSLARGGEQLIGADFLRHGQVIARLRFLHVGDGGQADVEAALGQFELALHSGLLGPRQAKVIGGRQHAEICVGDAQQQRLLGVAELRLGQRDLIAGLAVALERGPVEQRLVQGHGQCPGRALAVHRLLAETGTERGALGAGLGLINVAVAAVDLGQQCSARLRPCFQRGVATMHGGLQLHVLAQRRFIHALQFVGAGQRRQRAEQQKRGNTGRRHGQDL